MTKTRGKAVSSKEENKNNNKRKRKVKKVVEEENDDDELGPPSEEEQAEEEDLDYQEEEKPVAKKKKSSAKQTKSESASAHNTTTSSSKKITKILPFKLKTGFNKGKRKKSFRQIISKQDQTASNDETSEENFELSATSEESAVPTLNYNFIAAGNYSMTSRRKYCDITGLLCKYTNPHNKIQYHSSCLTPLIQNLSEQKIEQYLSLRNNI
ncbi:hypothetical protein FDP41_008052 [Naegleria fowleri]|uniref:Vps72/YL1 C-terminal domain-containing protein n=1 Tax=Naegleria fowleri TaxID=5763 RepID=A0A6A5C483_NAEFO|nr:uncharacterized protein FDP41_008052 [Naegleria fowleri]KAF0984137.1 hypothetical protein FDP41_008052 [Naegleria fowleri]